MIQSLVKYFNIFDLSDEKSIKHIDRNIMKSSDEQKMSRIYPPMRKVLVIEWPDQRTVFEKHKGKDFS